MDPSSSLMRERDSDQEVEPCSQPARCNKESYRRIYFTLGPFICNKPLAVVRCVVVCNGFANETHSGFIDGRRSNPLLCGFVCAEASPRLGGSFNRQPANYCWCF